VIQVKIYQEESMKLIKKTTLAQYFIAQTALFFIANSAMAVTLRIGNQGDALSMDPHSLNEGLQVSVLNKCMNLWWRTIKI
jgi:hypothetical protein